MELKTADGVVIDATFIEASVQPKGAVLIVPAMGVPQRFYEPFAKWLSSRGFHVLSFDFRGMGRSKKGSLAKVDADIMTWSQQDTAAAMEALAARAHGLPISWIGHSLGGQIVPFVPNREQAAKIVTVATGSGYWLDNAAPLKRRVWLLWFGAVPLATPLFGYFPGKRLGMVGDLPRGVIRQWRKWCLNPEYAVGAEGPAVRKLYADVKTPITSFSFTDDDMMSEKNVRSIHGFYQGASPSLVRLSPRELGVKKVGHFGFFREEMREPLWQRLVERELAVAS